MTKEQFAGAYPEIVSALKMRLRSKMQRIDDDMLSEALCLVYERVVVEDCSIRTAQSRSVSDACRMSMRGQEINVQLSKFGPPVPAGMTRASIDDDRRRHNEPLLHETPAVSYASPTRFVRQADYERFDAFDALNKALATIY